MTAGQEISGGAHTGGYRRKTLSAGALRVAGTPLPLTHPFCFSSRELLFRMNLRIPFTGTSGILIQRVSGDPARHEHHRHSGARVSRTAGEIQTAHIGTAIAWLERPKKASVAGEPIDRAVEHVVAVVDVLGSQRLLENDPRFDV